LGAKDQFNYKSSLENNDTRVMLTAMMAHCCLGNHLTSENKTSSIVIFTASCYCYTYFEQWLSAGRPANTSRKRRILL